MIRFQLVEANIFSDKICQLCYNDLEVFSQFRKDLTLKQSSLYRTAEKKHPEIGSTIFRIVKSETNEFIDCNPTESIRDDDDDLFNPEVVIKSETDEMETNLETNEDSLNCASWNNSLERNKNL